MGVLVLTWWWALTDVWEYRLPTASRNCVQQVNVIISASVSLCTGYQCSGSGTFWYGSGSSIRNSEGRMRLLRIWLQILLFSSVTFNMPKNFSKVIKKSQNSRNQRFSYHFSLDDGRIRIRIRIHTSDLWMLAIRKPHIKFFTTFQNLVKISFPQTHFHNKNL